MAYETDDRILSSWYSNLISETLPWYSYIIPFLTAVYIVISTSVIGGFVEVSDSREAHRMEQIPTIAQEEITRRLENVREQIRTTEEYTTVEYFKTLYEVYMVGDAITKDRYVLGNSIPPNPKDLKATEEWKSRLNTSTNYSLESFSLSNELMNRNPNVMRGLSADEIDAARTQVFGDYDRLSSVSATGGISSWPAVLNLISVYFLIGFIAVPMFYFIRLNREGLSMLFGIPKMFKWCLLWPKGLFVYPAPITRREQVKNFMKIVSYWMAAALSFGGAQAMASTQKAPSKSKSDDAIEEVMEVKSFVTFIDAPSPQLLPTLKVGPFVNDTYVTSDTFGWLTGRYDSDSMDVSNVRIREKINSGNWSLFFDGEFLNPSAVDVKELSIGYQFDSDWKIDVGELFHSGGFASPAPHLIKAVDGPDLPITFYGVGVGVSGPISNSWNVAFDVTGESGSIDQFGSLEFSGHLLHQIEHGIIRASFQLLDGSDRLILDTQQDYGPNRVRAAAYYRSDGENNVGGYVFYRRKVLNWLAVSTQIGYADGETSANVGFDTEIGKNVSFFASQSLQGGGFGARLQLRF